MCRWMGWLGQQLLMEEILFNSPHSIVDQSLNARMGAEPTNGDGFGLGWYGAGEGPGLYHSVEPAWSDPNLRELAAHVESPLFVAHVRAAIGSPVQQTNCHPFRYKNWLFLHNGYLGGFAKLRRELMFLVAPEYFQLIHGSTDTEVAFTLALTLGLTEDPLGAMEQTVGLIEEHARALGIEDAVQGTFGITDGATLWAVRYATSGPPRTLYTSADPGTVRRLYPDNPRLSQVTEDDRLVVSEPFSDLPGLWNPVPESTSLTVRRGGILEHTPFRPRVPEPAPTGFAGAAPA
jgi:predicted glutamine amidotransferase